MSNHKNLYFFNKEGDYLNFQYNNENERFEGDILFHENSTDTFKTYGIYAMEHVPSFEYEVPGSLSTNKFQLFNEFGFHFYGARYNDNQKIEKIEPVNNNPNFYSKWIYGDNFQSKFPIGSIVKFPNSTLEFSNNNQTYVVVGSKAGAIMVISQMDNATFQTSYEPLYLEPDSFSMSYVTGVNAFGVYDYLKPTYVSNLSNWNEPEFYDKYYVGKKLNVVGSEKNDEVLTVSNINLTDTVHFEYSANKTSLPANSPLIMEIITKTDVPLIYNGPMDITSNRRIKLVNDWNYPQILKPGVEFKIIGSSNNQNFYTVSPIVDFSTLTQPTFFATQSQVIYNNFIYECVQSYTHSFGDPNTQYITPANPAYWTNATYIQVEEFLVAENLLNSQLYLTTDRYYYSYGYTQSGEATMAALAQKYSDEVKVFNIDLYYLSNNIKADLIYSSDYSEVNFYHTQIGPTYSIGTKTQKSERLVEVEESLNYELNYNYSENFRYNVVINELDEFGLKITINGMVYDIETAFFYSSGVIDDERTIDRTLRNWLVAHYFRLLSLGIIVDLQFTGDYTSLFFNSILIKTEYPNVPIVVDDIQVGSTAEFYVEHSKYTFSSLGPFLNININGNDYSQQTTYYTSTNIADISTTLDNWYNAHYNTLLDLGIKATAVNTILKFDLKSLERKIDIKISTGKLNLPGVSDYILSNKIKGNEGVLVASNEMVLATGGSYSFQTDGFATGMAFAINNTFYPYVNQDFVIQNIEPYSMDLSYQGPFWGLTSSICNSSAFITLAFDLGFGATGCFIPGPTGQGGPFNPLMFGTGFSIDYNYSTYTTNYYNFGGFGVDNIKDIEYLQLTGAIYGFGDNLVVVDALYGHYITTVILPGSTQSNTIEMEYNPINSYFYCLSDDYIWVVDPTSNSLINTITFSSISGGTGYDLEINTANGDVYVSYSDLSTLHIFPFDSFTPISLSLSGRGGSMVFNEHESDMYVTTDSNIINRIITTVVSGVVTRSIQSSYGVLGATGSIFYDPVYESILAFGSQSMYRIDNNSVSQIASITTTNFADMTFNVLTGEMNISNGDNSFNRFDLQNNTNQSTSLSSYGYVVMSPFDGAIYLSSQTLNSVSVVDPTNGSVVHDEPMTAPTTKLIYNPERKSIWLIQPSLNRFVEIEVEIITEFTLNTFTSSIPEDNLYGTLDPDYEPRPDIWLKTRDYFRKPRENYEGDVPVKYYWKWLSDEVSDFFMYDFSGTQLASTGSYAYTGPKPLTNPVLRKTSNTDFTKNSYPEYQQTIFDKIEYSLSYIDDENDISVAPEAFELFLGFQSKDEGALRSVLQLYKKEEIEFSIISDSVTNLTFETLDPEGDKRGKISISQNSSEFYTGRGLKKGHHLVIYVKDSTNVKKQYISNNNAILVKIREVYSKMIIVDFFSPSFDELESENTVLSNYPDFGKTTYLKTTFKVPDMEIGRFITYGQTEEEDIRFKIELGNVGKLISPEEIFIFKEYDINEGGIDWLYLNKKRKEMLMVKNVIYPYIGAYKSLINAINYFGYNDLQLNEYYLEVSDNPIRNGSRFKVEIPDIFDNTVEGWNEKDFIKRFYPNVNYKQTNEFNLTYFITDKEGNYILNYSLDEIIIKLQGLKYWLKRNIVPITHKILDITGSSWFNHASEIHHTQYDMQIINIKEEMTPVIFRMNEVYLSPVNSGSSVYNCVLDLYSMLKIEDYEYASIPGASNPSPLLTNGVKPYNGSTLIAPDFFDIKIRTYKIYKEWAPFTTYVTGDKVSYYDKIYESQIDNNKIKNPRKFENTDSWSLVAKYQPTSVVEYNRDIYVYSGLGATSSTSSPNLDSLNWLKITEWKEIDLEPVQTINEFRGGDDLLPYNFTVDSNIDPFIVVEITSHSGYGQAYTDKKNYYLKGLKDLTEPYRYLDPIGPFVPIMPVYT